VKRAWLVVAALPIVASLVVTARYRLFLDADAYLERHQDEAVQRVLSGVPPKSLASLARFHRGDPPCTDDEPEPRSERVRALACEITRADLQNHLGLFGHLLTDREREEHGERSAEELAALAGLAGDVEFRLAVFVAGDQLVAAARRERERNASANADAEAQLRGRLSARQAAALAELWAAHRSELSFKALAAIGKAVPGTCD
jgi:hypothetical protein